MRARLTALLAAGLLAAAGTTLTTTSAAAAPSPQAESSRSTTAAERAATLRYWTKERMAKAVPMAPGGGKGKPGGGGGGGGGGDTGTLNDVASAGAITETKLVGKVFFTLKNTNYVCSGSVVNAANDNTVLTAGHCLHEGRGGSRGFATNFVFVPGYDGTKTLESEIAPYGRWAASKLHTTSQWASSGDFVYDVGFARVAGSTALEVRLGGAYGIDFGRAPVGTPTVSYGYPAASPFDGRTRQFCNSATVIEPYGSDTQGLPCNMTGGSSGGPWILGGTHAHSVNSYKYTNDATTMYGPFLTEVARTLFDTAQV